MSWQAYVDNNLVGSGKLSRAAIIGAQGGVWASSAGFNLSSAEQTAVIQAHASPERTQASGVTLAGTKFIVFSADGRSIYGRKAADGCLLVKTTQAILVAEYTAPTQAAEATPVVESLADYLISVGY